ncbi:MAG: hypothetical protein ACR2L2_11395 [Acidobacteriota bacterium]
MLFGYDVLGTSRILSQEERRSRRLPRNNMTRIFLILSITAALLNSFQVVSPAQRHSEGQKSLDPPERFLTNGPRPISIRQLGATDLRLVRTDVSKLERTIERANFFFQNQTEKQITAGVFIYNVVVGESIQFSQTEWFDSRLLPGTTNGTEPLRIVSAEFDDQIQFGTEPSGIQLIVDYVEFSDGSWSGPNARKINEIIKAERRGAQRALGYVSKKYFNGETAEVTKILEAARHH